MAMEESEDDLAFLLKLDPAKVAILASHDNHCLEKLQDFASKLSYYTDLVQNQQMVVSSSSSAAASSSAASGKAAEEEGEGEGDRAVPETTASSVTEPVTEPTEPPELRATQAVPVTPPEVEQSNPVAALPAKQEENEEEAISERNVGDSASIAGEIQNHDSTVKRETRLAFESSEEAASEKIKEEELGIRAREEPKEPDIVDLTMDDEDDLTDEQTTSEPSNLKRRREEVASTSRESGESNELKPRKLSRGHSGRLSTSELRRSEGRTRTCLNNSIRTLGLKAKFSQGAMSTRGGFVSHITLNSEWNDLPKDEKETLEWWLGEGPKRLQLVSRLDPSSVEQSESGIPVFWAEKQGRKGGNLCSYVGHYRCVRFQGCTGETKMKGIPRQALLEFQFVRFDDSLASRIAEIPDV